MRKIHVVVLILIFVLSSLISKSSFCDDHLSKVTHPIGNQNIRVCSSLAISHDTKIDVSIIGHNGIKSIESGCEEMLSDDISVYSCKKTSDMKNDNDPYKEHHDYSNMQKKWLSCQNQFMAKEIQQLIPSLDNIIVESFKKSQKQWLESRNLTCMVESVSEYGGISSTIVYQDCIAQITTDRIKVIADIELAFGRAE